jgi:uncharacterized membrane protein YagU involved in acid resistance
MILAGLAGGLLGALVTNVYTRVTSTATGGHEGEGAAPGAHRAGRGMQPPQALHDANDDATIKVGSIAYQAITGRSTPASSRAALGAAAHYAFSTSAGLLYGIIASRFPPLRSGYGVAYGCLVWAVADEGIVPALGLSRGPRQLPLGIHIYSLVGHAIFGATLESALRLACAWQREQQRN